MSAKNLVLRVVLLLGLTGAPAFACPDDGDGDGICDALDNCPAVANPGQAECGMVALGRWVCLSGDHRSKASFKALIALAGSFGGPVTATVSQDYDIDRTGTIANCRVSWTKLACKAL